jgi:hypothetical protein
MSYVTGKELRFLDTLSIGARLSCPSSREFASGLVRRHGRKAKVNLTFGVDLRLTGSGIIGATAGPLPFAWSPIAAYWTFSRTGDLHSVPLTVLAKSSCWPNRTNTRFQEPGKLTDPRKAYSAWGKSNLASPSGDRLREPKALRLAPSRLPLVARAMHLFW